MIICKECRKEKKHHAKGLCSGCYNKKIELTIIVCKNCGKKKENMGGGLCSECYLKEYYWVNKEAISRQKKRYYKEHKEEISKRIKNCRIIICKNCGQKKENEGGEFCRECYGGQYYQTNKIKILNHQKEYYSKNKRKHAIQAKKYRQKPEAKEKKRKNKRKRFKEDIPFKLAHTISSHIRKAIKSNKGGRHWENLVGYTLNDLKRHLENQFEPGMTWDNYGSYWHIDHKIPKSWFDYTKPEDSNFKKCWALDNLQPKKSKENLGKGNRYAEPTLNQFFDCMLGKA